MYRKHIFCLTLLCGVASIYTPMAHAASAKSLVEKGNKAYAEGDVNTALQAYTEAQEKLPDDAIIAFNRGIALYQQGNYEEAQKAFSNALKSDDITLQAATHLNVGNCLFSQARLQNDQRDLETAKKTLENSLPLYRKAFKLNPELTVAAKNIEKTRKEIKRIQNEIKKQEKQQQQQQQAQDEAKEALDKLIQEQQQTQEQTQKEAQQPSGDPSQTEQLAKQQQQHKKDAEQLSEELKKQPAPTMEKAQEHLDKAMSHQEDAEQDLHDQQAQEAQKDQEKALEELQKAREALNQPKEDQQDKQQQQQGESDEKQKDDKQQQKSSDENDKEQENAQQQQQQQQSVPEEGEESEMKAAPLDEAAQDILEEEKELREMRRVRQPGGYRPVEKDW